MFDNLCTSLAGGGQPKFNELMKALSLVSLYPADQAKFGIYIQVIESVKLYPAFQYELSTLRYGVLYEAYTYQQERFKLEPHGQANACEHIARFCTLLKPQTDERFCDVIPRVCYEIFQKLSNTGGYL